MKAASKQKKTPSSNGRAKAKGSVKPSIGLPSPDQKPQTKPSLQSKDAQSGERNGYKETTPLKPTPKVPVPVAAAVPTTEVTKLTGPLSETAARLQDLQRQRTVVMKSKMMQANRLQAVIAGTLGYSSGMAEAERKKKFTEASAIIKGVADGTKTHPLEGVIKVTLVGINAFEEMKSKLESKMKELARTLPVAAWVDKPEQKGFGMLGLAIVIGECGDLGKFSTVSKVWRRMGCAPWSYEDKTLMGSTWRYGKEGKLPAEEWTKYGYSPRRRSISFNISEALLKQNFMGKVRSSDTGGETDCVPAGPYRQRYEAAKLKLQTAHPDYSPMRCHLHGMLLMTKLLLKELYLEWHNRPIGGWEHEHGTAKGDA